MVQFGRSSVGLAAAGGGFFICSGLHFAGKYVFSQLHYPRATSCQELRRQLFFGLTAEQETRFWISDVN